jgi:dethiobiotin synthetase
VKGAWFVTGTDTGVGKTRASAALLHAARRQGLRGVGMKPVAAGGEVDAQGRFVNEDLALLRAASSVAVPAELDNPYALPDPVSPHLAAQRAGVRIDVGLLAERAAALRARADTLVVEGAGGFLVPLGDGRTGADLARALGLPVILVVGLRLGCLNHALLTQEAIAARGLVLAGWIANQVEPGMLSPEASLAYLTERLEAPRLAHWPWSPATAPETLAFERTPG